MTTPPGSVRDALDALCRTGVVWGPPGTRPAPDLPSTDGPGRGAPGVPVRPAAVLVLLGALGGRTSPRGAEDVEVLLVERAASLSHHPGQVAFPGGRLDPDDAGPVAAALREATEETGIDTAGVDVVGTLAPLPLPVSNHVVTPVLAWWAAPSAVRAVDAGESAAVLSVPVSGLVDPDNRRVARIDRGGRPFDTPAFVVGTRIVWGFTGIVLDRVLDGLGWTVPWEPRPITMPR
ncbi:NUDIX hydrolase [Sanguibacter suaedae]|uniref:NUDIX hydrolase n=1 Tax=Sanguibacter suaedae TaxID=2795737 RepID=UPI0027DB78F0|nr:CoA pyrophosphatase [Sanguibacter suaedae]